MVINWVRLSLGIALLINAPLTVLTHPITTSLDTTAIIVMMTTCFSFLLIALSFETKHNKEVK
jgi:hypothetical protein